MAGRAQPLLADALGAHFAGVFITRPPSKKVVFRSTDPADATAVAKIAETVGLGNDWSFETAKYPLARLQADAVALSQELSGRADVWWDTVGDSVEVRLLDLQDMPEDLPETAHVAVVPTLASPTTSIGGGKFLSTCSTAFSVYRSPSTGILTAGHCSPPQSYGTTTLIYQNGQNSGSTDAEWFTTPGINDLNRVYLPNGSWVVISSWQSHTAQVSGASFLKMGSTTGFVDGWIDNTGFCATWVPNRSCTYIMGSHDGYDMSSPGDSGGSIWNNSSAWGVISGETYNIHTFCSCNVVWTPVDYVWGPLNITLKTW